MPIYEYACKKCEHLFDVLQKMSDDPLTYCPECGAPELRKLISAPSFRLKGGGWYETDFKTGDKRNLAGEAAKSAADDKGDKADKSGKADKSATAEKSEKKAEKPAAVKSGKGADGSS
jgi:putative FmdB family regulatory protein